MTAREVEGKDRQITDLTKKARNDAEDTDRAVADAVNSQKSKVLVEC